jgi:hypothetical protein
VTAVVHVHSALSTGLDTLDSLAAEAEKFGIDAVLLTDNFLLRFEYGLFPMRGLIRRTVEFPSVKRNGIARFLSEVQEANLRHPRVLLIPGVEVTPRYYWTGSVLGKNLTMHDAQKNILVLGLKFEEDYLRLPVAGNHEAYEYGWRTVLGLSPVLLVPPGIWLINHRVDRKVRVGWTVVVVRSRHVASGVVLLIVSGALLVNNYPFAVPRYDQYREGDEIRPHQDLIDYVRERGGMTIWSMPEVKDFHQFDYGRLGVVTVKTDPYTQVLLQTSGYTGFGAVHLDANTIGDPGGAWDVVLQEYARGRRRGTPPWGIGELAYHGVDATKKYLYHVQTVLWVRERTPPALLEAMASGRMYARQRTMEYGLVLADFSVASGRSAARVVSGQTLRVPGSDSIQVRVSVDATDGRTHPLSMQLIRDGQVIARRMGATPFEWDFDDHAPAPGDGTYYRLLIDGGAHRIVANPIFVQGQPAPR